MYIVLNKESLEHVAEKYGLEKESNTIKTGMYTADPVPGGGWSGTEAEMIAMICYLGEKEISYQTIDNQKDAEMKFEKLRIC